MNPKIAKVVVGLPVDGPFDYAVGRELRGAIAVGQRVRVTFNRQNRVGFVVGSASSSRFKHLNPIISLLDNGPVLDGRNFACARAFSAHYGCSLGEAIETFLPRALRGDRASLTAENVPGVSPTRAAGPGRSILVHDQTRDRRWPLIIEKIKAALNGSKTAIVLVPEAAFIKDTVGRLANEISGGIEVFDKKLAPKKELALWEELRSGKHTVVVGTRSAVFAPLPNLGLIVIDEEENGAYKQEQSPHYHAREVAQMRADIEGCDVVYVASSPSAEIWDRAKRGKWERVTLTGEERGGVQIIDMTNYNPRKTSLLSFPLQNEMQKALESGGRVLLYLNRLGFGTRTHCQQCGYIAKCEHCNVNLTYLFSQKTLVCRHCQVKKNLPKVCPDCQGAYLRSTGTGIEKLESEVARSYPQARIHRYDRQTEEFPGNADIIIATQAVFRRHEPWTVPLVAVLNFDAQLHHFDFRAGEKAFSLLVHLRQLAAKKLLIQTRMADNYCLKAIQKMDYDAFYREELKLRRQLHLPPSRHLVALGLRGKKEDAVFELAKQISDKLDELRPADIEVTDPHPDVNPKLRDKYRFTVVVKGKSVHSVLKLVKRALKDVKKRNVVITVNVDP
ncbi:MAG: primosomal protein N' [Omnitrophica WOR_2 bacterium RIFCSPHIGHO2_02_FULL_52_10]|nr:MAG: primosomal protein N' [Omnitrophica WOR_2 bacterium RIFCSPHIGHO2_02_FULL_52_10]